MGAYQGKRLGEPTDAGPPPPSRAQLDEAQAALYALTDLGGLYRGYRKFVDVLIVASMKGTRS